MRSLVFILGVAFALALWALPPVPESPPGSGRPGSVERDSADASLSTALRTMTNQAMNARRAERRALQRKGYVETLAAVRRADGPAALLAFSRMNLQVSYALSHHPILIFFQPVPDTSHGATHDYFMNHSGPMPFVLPDDWTMPEDPWR